VIKTRIVTKRSRLLLAVIPAVGELAPAAIGRGGDPSEEKSEEIP